MPLTFSRKAEAGQHQGQNDTTATETHSYPRNEDTGELSEWLYAVHEVG